MIPTSPVLSQDSNKSSLLCSNFRRQQRIIGFHIKSPNDKSPNAKVVTLKKP